MIDSKAQVSLEVLIMIGGAILLATIIGLYLKGLSGQVTGRIAQDTKDVVQGSQ